MSKPIKSSNHHSGSVSVMPIRPPADRQVTIKSTTIVSDGLAAAPINLPLTWDDSDSLILRSSIVSSLRSGGAFDSVVESNGSYSIAIRLDQAGITNMVMPTCHLKGEIIISKLGGGNATRRSFDITSQVMSAASTAKNKAVSKLLAELELAVQSL